jgi:hypothetical protein
MLQRLMVLLFCAVVLHENGLVTWTSNKKPSCLRRHVVNDVPVAEDLAVWDGSEVVSDDHTHQGTHICNL